MTNGQPSHADPPLPAPVDLIALAEAVLGGTASAEQRAALDRLVREDPVASRRYIRYIHDSRFIQKLAAAASSSEPTAEPPFDATSTPQQATPEMPQADPSGFFPALWDSLPSVLDWRTDVGKFWMLFVLFGALLFGSFGWLVWSSMPSPRLAEKTEPEGEPPVARLGLTARALWADGAKGMPTQGLDYFPGDTLALQSGMATIVFRDGAETIIEGPCKITIDGPGAARLERGKLAATVEKPSAQGFRVDTPFATVTDFGTEFGVHVTDEGTDLGVFHGEVRMAVAGSKRAVRVTAGGVARADRRGNLSSSSRGAERLAIARQVRLPDEPKPDEMEPDEPPEATDFVGRVLSVNWRASSGNAPAMSRRGPAPDPPENTAWNDSSFPWAGRKAPYGGLRWSDGSSCPIVIEFPQGINSYNPPQAKGLPVFAGHVNSKGDERCVVRLRGLPTGAGVTCDVYVISARNEKPLATRFTVGGRTVALPGDGPTDRFVAGENFEVFRGVRPTAQGTIDIQVTGDQGGVFSGLQLHVKEPAAASEAGESAGAGQ